MTRRPCAAGRFYPAEPGRLRSALDGFLGADQGAAGPERVAAIVVPHAGYVYSGAVAGAVYSAVRIPGRVVLIGPNHTGLGPDVSLMSYGSWETPLGQVAVDTALARALISASDLFESDTDAHAMEHSLEVQLPFIQRLNPGAAIVPVAVMMAGAQECREMGAAVARAVSECNEEVLIVASSDMNHFEPDDVTRIKDRAAIERVLALDAGGLLGVTTEKGISMCGVLPTAVAINAAAMLGARGARLVSYATSADAGGDPSQVVGYAGIIIGKV